MSSSEVALGINEVFAWMNMIQKIVWTHPKKRIKHCDGWVEVDVVLEFMDEHVCTK